MAGLVLFTLMSNLACPATTEEELPPEETLVSGIQPPPLLLPALKSLSGQAPFQGLTVAAIGSADIQFRFDTADAKYGAIYIFSAQPTVDPDGTSITNLAQFCVAGASNMAGHVWNHNTQVLGITGTGSQFYACQNNPVETLSQTVKVIYDNITFTTGTYYWVVLGYDQYYRLTHSSTLFSFNVP